MASVLDSLMDNLEGDDALQRFTLSAVHQFCRFDPSLKVHFDDLKQQVQLEWMLYQVDERFSKYEIMSYAKNKARHTIQMYIAKNKEAVRLPKAVSLNSDSDYEFIEHSDLHFMDRVDYTIDTASATWLKSAHYLKLSKYESWLVWFASEGFSLEMIAKILGRHKRTIKNHLNAIKKRNV